MDIIQFFIDSYNHLYRQYCQLLLFVCRYIPLKQQENHSAGKGHDRHGDCAFPGLFAVCQLAFLRLNKKLLAPMLVGVLFTYIGLVVFLTGANVGFMPAGFLFHPCKSVQKAPHRRDRPSATGGGGSAGGEIFSIPPKLCHCEDKFQPVDKIHGLKCTWQSTILCTFLRLLLFFVLSLNFRNPPNHAANSGTVDATLYASTVGG